MYKDKTIVSSKYGVGRTELILFLRKVCFVTHTTSTIGSVCIQMDWQLNLSFEKKLLHIDTEKKHQKSLDITYIHFQRIM